MRSQRLCVARAMVELRAEAGPIGAVLRDTASREAADLIIVGSRGRGVAASAIGGSVSADLTDHAPCPVLIVRRPALAGSWSRPTGSPSAKAIPEILARWRFLRGLPDRGGERGAATAAAADFLVTAWAPTPEIGHGTPATTARATIGTPTSWLSACARQDGTPPPRCSWGSGSSDRARRRRSSGCDLVITGSRGWATSSG